MKKTLEETLKNLLLNNIKIYINDKVYKEGKVMSFKENNFAYEIMLCKDNKNKKFELPIPFNIEHHSSEKVIYFDYRIKTLVNNKNKTTEYLKLTNNCKSRFYNIIMEICT